MRVLYPGGLATGDSSSALRNRGLAAAMKLSGVEVLGADSSPQPDSALQAIRRKYVRDGDLASLLRRSRPDAVIVYPGLGQMNGVASVAAEQGIPVVADIADWYDWRHVPRSSLPQWVLNEIAVRKAGPRAQGCIAVSEYLGRYFGTRGASTLVVAAAFESPPVAEVVAPTDSRCHVAYVGSVASKDRLAARHLIEYASQFDPLGQHVKVHIVGGGVETLRSALPPGVMIPASVVVHGRVPRQEALDVLARCDFSVVQRDPLARYARAGFPSKVAESLLLGTPVISNLSSDLAGHLADGENAIVLAGAGLADMCEGLQRALDAGVTSSRTQIAAQARSRYLPSAIAPGLGDFLRALAFG